MNIENICRANVNDHIKAEFINAYKRVYTAGTKMAIFGYEDDFKRFNKLLNRSQLPNFLPESFGLESRVFLFPAFHFLFEAFDRKLQQYIEADLINYNIRAWSENFLERSDDRNEPFAVLKLKDLKAGFVVCLVPLVLSAFVFCIEWLVTIKNLMVFLIIFKKYFDFKKFA